MRRSRCEPGLWTPGVSTKTICAAGCTPFSAGTSTTPAMRLRVVCGLAETMATFSPVRTLRSVLLPALGRPRMATNPDFKGENAPDSVYDVSGWPGRVCGFPPLRQKQERRKDGAPKICAEIKRPVLVRILQSAGRRGGVRHGGRWKRQPRSSCRRIRAG